MTGRTTALDRAAEEYARTGLAKFSLKDSPFSADEWELMTSLIPAERSRYEHIDTGDTDEPSSVFVLRLLIDGDPPTTANPSVSEPLVGLLAAAPKLAFYQRVIGEDALIIRRAQLHLYQPGGYVGYHRDSESNSEYVAAVVLQFEAAASGGEFVVYDERGGELTVRDYSMLMTEAELPHEVKRVEEGRRVTLAYWLARAA